VGDSSDQDQTAAVVDGVDDPMVANADPIIVEPCQPDRARGARIVSQLLNRASDATQQRVV
jgi:hypothetical protein